MASYDVASALGRFRYIASRAERERFARNSVWAFTLAPAFLRGALTPCPQLCMGISPGRYTEIGLLLGPYLLDDLLHNQTAAVSGGSGGDGGAGAAVCRHRHRRRPAQDLRDVFTLRPLLCGDVVEQSRPARHGLHPPARAEGAARARVARNSHRPCRVEVPNLSMGPGRKC